MEQQKSAQGEGADVDVVIVGAGLSGISAAYHVRRYCRDKSYLVLEGRADLGGTWDLFRYPGVRSDSDMFTLGFSFRPWTDGEAIADAPAILNYLNETVAAFGIDQHIRFNHRVRHIAWDSGRALWTLTVQAGAETRTLRARFIILGTGYYSYTEPHAPDFPNAAAFKGQIVHPQFWPQDLDWRNKQVVVIGSGATAATLVPALAKDAAKVTMLQRSPTYMVAKPRRDRFANVLRALLPRKMAYSAARWKSIRQQYLDFHISQRFPGFVARTLIKQAAKALGPNVDVHTHFAPRYAPWDQRVCLLPDGDLFAAVREGRAEVVTRTILCFTEDGIMLDDESVLPADIIITATGLKMEVGGGMEISVDGAPVPLRRTIVYKGCMFSGLPNLVGIVGYSNASWTLKADLIARFAVRLINHLGRKGQDYVVPDATGVLPQATPLLSLSSGYVERAALRLPKQGDADPWRIYHNIFKDRRLLGRARFNDGALKFARATGVAQEHVAEPAGVDA